jgi:hypothetical protein
MNWFALQVIASSILRWQEQRGAHEIDLLYSVALLIFCLIWPGSHQAREWRTLASLLSTSLITFTILMLFINGPLGSLAIFWPALMSRTEPNRETQRVCLVVLQWLLVWACLGQPLLLALNVALLLASLTQVTGSRPMRWFALGAMALAAGPLAIALSMSDPPEAFVKNTLLLTLPQLGLFWLARKSVKSPSPQ